LWKEIIVYYFETYQVSYRHFLTQRKGAKETFFKSINGRRFFNINLKILESQGF